MEFIKKTDIHVKQDLLFGTCHVEKLMESCVILIWEILKTRTVILKIT